MTINFFSQHFMLYAYKIEKVHKARSKYLLLIHDTPEKLDQAVLVGRIKNTCFKHLTYTEVFP